MNCAKTAEPIEMPFGLWTRVGPRKHVFQGAQIPHVKGQLLMEWTCRAWPTTPCCELCKNGWTNWFAIWVVDSGGPKEAHVQSYLPGGTIGATWQIRLNRPSAAAMRPYVKLLWPLVITWV